MYRANMSMEEGGLSQEQRDMENVISRVSNLPIIHSAVDQVQIAYSKAKESHPYVKSTLEVAEKTVTVAAENAKPYVQKFDGPLSTANTYANKGLDKLEEKVPVITKPTEEVYETAVKPRIDYVKNVAESGMQKITDTKDMGVQKVLDTANYGKSTASNVKDYTLQHVNAALHTNYGQVLVNGVDKVLTKTEEYVDYYLPPAEENRSDEHNGSAEGVQQPQGNIEDGEEQPGIGYDQVKRVGELSSKVRKRMYVQAIKQMQHLQLRSTQTLDSLHFTVDLIEYAKSNIDTANQKVKDSFHTAQQKVIDTWTLLNTDKTLENGSGEGHAGDERLEKLSEHQTLVLARNLTTILSTAYQSAYTASYSLLPATLQQSLQHGKQQVDDLYKMFNQASHFADIPVSWLQHSRESLHSVRSELSAVLEAVINSKALSWLISRAE